MALTAKGINALGVIFSGAVLVGGLNFVVLPQLEAAEEYNQQSEQVDTDNSEQNERINELSEYQNNPEELEQQLSTMRDQLPNSNSATDIQRAIVESLGTNIELISFSYGDSQSFEPPEPPSVSLSESSPPFSLGEGDSDSSDEDEEAGGSGAATGLTATPVEIQVNAGGAEPLAQFLNNLQTEGRLFLVVRVDITGGENSKDAHIHAYALSEQ